MTQKLCSSWIYDLNLVAAREFQPLMPPNLFQLELCLSVSLPMQGGLIPPQVPVPVQFAIGSCCSHVENE